METLRTAFQLKPWSTPSYIHQAWPTAPRFTGNPRQDPPVNDWLKDIQKGCKERGVPKDYWADVAIAVCGVKARKRLDEVKNVMDKMHGGKDSYRWTWKRFKTAMRNMGWTLDYDKKEAIPVEARPSLLWWFTPKSDEETWEKVQPPKSPIQGSESSFWLTRKIRVGNVNPTEPPLPPPQEETPSLRRRSSVTSIRFGSWFTADPGPAPQSDTAEKGKKSQSRPISQTSQDGILGRGMASAPSWLLNVCSALDNLNVEHPKTMSVLSAILITAGTLPTLPALAAGGTGVLATSAVQAVGAVALGVGSWLQARQGDQLGGGDDNASMHSRCSSCGKS